MKTDLVEIFQTLRASAQPYTAMGFTATKNSETEFELFAEKVTGETPGKNLFFAGIIIKENTVEFCLFPEHLAEADKINYHQGLLAVRDGRCFKVSALDDDQLANIEEALAEGFKIYKEKGWV